MHEIQANLQALLYCRKFPYEHAIDQLLINLLRPQEITMCYLHR